MSPKIFATGLSGYIGGDAIAHLIAKHPEYQIRALLRSLDQASEMKARYPILELVEGSLDSLSLLKEEAKEADVVLQMADSDHSAGTFALIEGLAEADGTKGTYIHMSGAANLIDFSFPFGAGGARIYGEDDDAATIFSLPQDRIHAIIEQKIIAEGEKFGVKTAIVSPPMVYGTGRGPVKREGFSGIYLDAVIKHKKAFVVEAGENLLSQTHVSDISTAVELLVGEALGENSATGKAGWEKDGYYFVESGELAFSQQAEMVAKLLLERGLIKTAEIDHLTVEEVGKIHPYATMMFGASVRSRAQKLRTLKWKPNGPLREQTLDATLDASLTSIGRKKSYVTNFVLTDLIYFNIF